MALVRILVDGYSLLHSWPQLAPGRARHSAAARGQLIQRLGQYQDACGTPVTVFFDGASERAGNPGSTPGEPGVEILYSKSGQTADQMIERAAHRLQPYGEVLVVTNDAAERETVLSLGGMAASCGAFIEEMEMSQREFQLQLKAHNRKERTRFKQK